MYRYLENFTNARKKSVGKPSREVSRKKVVFALVRGQEFLSRYRNLILRTRSIADWTAEEQGIDHIIFHEGNITAEHQKYIRRKSRLPRLDFVNVQNNFKPGKGQIWSGRQPHRLGYALMCRFNFFYVWDYLKNYDEAYRVDGDCIIAEAPLKIPQGLVYFTGKTIRDSHRGTIETLPPVLARRGFDSLKTRIPYTNFYGTRPDFWLQDSVQEHLEYLAGHPDCLENRWGDHYVHAQLLYRYFAAEDPLGLLPNITYWHGSNFDLIHNNQISRGHGAKLLNSPTTLLGHLRLGA